MVEMVENTREGLLWEIDADSTARAAGFLVLITVGAYFLAPKEPYHPV